MLLLLAKGKEGKDVAQNKPHIGGCWDHAQLLLVEGHRKKVR